MWAAGFWATGFWAAGFWAGDVVVTPPVVVPPVVVDPTLPVPPDYDPVPFPIAVPSTVDICNIALSHIGSDALVASLDPPDGSVEAGHCVRFLPLARRAMIQTGGWAFTKRRVELAEVQNVSTTWLYAYALPADCLHARRVLTKGEVASVFAFADMLEGMSALRLDMLLHDRASADFEIEGRVLRTNEPEAVLFYVRDVGDVNAFPPTFVSALTWALASYLAGPIIKGVEGARMSKFCREMALNEASASAVLDANASHQTSQHVPDWIRNR
jgi:hypothetical protein